MRNKYTSLWIWLLLCPLALDYKAGLDDGNHVMQVIMMMPVLGAGLILWLIAPSFTRRSRFRSIITAATITTVVGSIVTQLMQDNDFGNYLRTVLPFGLFLLGYLAACRPWQADRLEQFEKALFWSMVVSLVFSFAYGVATSGGPLDDVRYRIISVTFLGLQGVILHEFVVAKRITKVTLAILLGTILIELLSVTRSLLVGTVALFIFATWLSAPSARHLVKAGVRALLTGLLIAAMVAGTASFFPDVAEHWSQRIYASKETTSGRDPTTITRLAEMKDQYDQVTSTPSALIAGKGYGAIYHYSPDYLPELAGQISKKDFYAIRDFAAGHNFWVYQFFAGGLLFGLWLPLAILLALGLGGVAYRTWRRRVPDLLYLPVMGRSLLLLAGLPAMSIGGNPLGPRYSGLVFGVALGLLVATYTRLSYAMQVRGAQRVAQQGMAKKHRPGTPPPSQAPAGAPVAMPMPVSAHAPTLNEGRDSTDTLSRFTSA
ncbi:hypothetical protein M0D69_32880 [Caballeronia sp. SEWSISQ10-4 2]|uniref:hypothetical protein n=1 Tax=Caballeronia sp. SEWSISQ10-4 2 TaxID=2937438 RepID=UPI0026568C16|nr:hypothetical protein [Caballeronia sp. SEWSISQ10-4 2]MDN7182731.1 hypothetical protein [Caballeronia sp. SEWSISQ10-4 2]